MIRKIAHVNGKSTEIDQDFIFEAELAEKNEDDTLTDSTYRNDADFDPTNNASTITTDNRTESNSENLNPQPARRTASLGASLRNFEPQITAEERKRASNVMEL